MVQRAGPGRCKGSESLLYGMPLSTSRQRLQKRPQFMAWCVAGSCILWVWGKYLRTRVHQCAVLHDSLPCKTPVLHLFIPPSPTIPGSGRNRIPNYGTSSYQTTTSARHCPPLSGPPNNTGTAGALVTRGNTEAALLSSSPSRTRETSQLCKEVADTSSFVTDTSLPGSTLPRVHPYGRAGCDL